MTTLAIDNSQRTAAKVAGWSGLLTFAIVVFGNYVLLNPLVVSGNAVATAQNIVAHQTQLRITVVCFLTYTLGVVVLLTALYVIFKPINPGLALAGALFLSVRPLPARQGRIFLWSVGIYGAATIVFGLSRSCLLYTSPSPRD